MINLKTTAKEANLQVISPLQFAMKMNCEYIEDYFKHCKL